jgi:hypothetical protein
MKRLLIFFLLAGTASAREFDFSGAFRHPVIPDPKVIEADPPQTNTFCALNLNCTITATWTFSNPIVGSITGNAATSTLTTNATNLVGPGSITGTFSGNHTNTGIVTDSNASSTYAGNAATATTATTATTSTNLTGPGVISGSFSGTSTLTGNITQQGNNTHSGTETFTGGVSVGNFNQEIWVGATSQYPTLASALAAATAGTLIRLPAGVWTTAGSNAITLDSIHIVGEGPGSTTLQITSATADMFTCTTGGNSFELGNMTINSSVTRTAGYVMNASASCLYGYMHDLRVLDMYGFFKSVGSGGTAPSGWRFWNLRNRTSSGNHSGSFFDFCSSSGDGSACADYQANFIYSESNVATYDAPQVHIGSGADTIKLENYDMGFSPSTQTQPVVLIDNVGNGGGGTVPPKYIRINKMSIEGGATTDCIQLVDTLDLEIQGLYAANCKRGVNISGGASMHGGIRFIGGHIFNNQQGGLYITSAITAGPDLEVNGTEFSNNSMAATNTTDDIQIAAGTTKFKIVNAIFSRTAFGSAVLSRWGINILAGSSNDYVIADNRCVAADHGTGCLSDNGTGAIKWVVPPSLGASVAWSLTGTSGATLTMTDSAGRCGQISGPNSTTNMFLGTCSSGQSVDFFSGASTIAGSIDSSQGWNFRGAIRPQAANVYDLGTTATPWRNLWLGTAATNNFEFVPGATSAARVINILDPGAATTLDLTSNTTTTTSQLLHGSATAGLGTWSAFAPATDCATCVTSSAALTSNAFVLGGGGQVAKTVTAFTTNGTTTMTVGVAAGGNGVLALAGNTSGTATFTAPAVAGTTTNAVVSSNVIQAPGLNTTNVLISPTAPTIAGAGCGGSAASIVVSNSTAAFKINVGTAPGSACTITMPAATTGWNCFATDITTNSTTQLLVKQTGAESTTSVTLTNFSDVAAASAFTANDILKVACTAD